MILKCGISVVFPKYAIKDYNPLDRLYSFIIYLNDEFTVPFRDVRCRNSYIGTLGEYLIDQLAYEASFCVTLCLQYFSCIS
jgi:hypothetical protein